MTFAYHGTNAENVESIFENGILPREATGRSNWDKNDMESIPDHVYLTRLYGIYFGMSTVENLSEESIAVFKIDLDKLDWTNLYPDEDYIEQGIRFEGIENIEPPKEYNPNAPIDERTEHIRDNIASYKTLWMDSFSNLGNISHKGYIPPKAIKSVSILNAPSSFYMNIDPLITIQNALYTGNKYEFYTNLIFDEEYTVEEALFQINIPLAGQEDISESKKEQFKEMFKQTGQVEQVQELLNGNFWIVKQNPNYK